jgi:malonyl-CoA decarboxylase
MERVWASIAERGRGKSGAAVPPLKRARIMAEALLSEAGEASGAAIAHALHNVLRALSPADRLAFALTLASNFTPNADRLKAAAEAYLADPSPEQARALAQAAEPPRQELLRRMNLSPGGTAALVTLRREILGHLRQNPALRPLDWDLHHLFGSWFNRGFLEMRRMDWNTPAAMLEKLIEYEAVHEIHGWDDLRRRLDGDRRCFGFFHPALPGEPLIFVEVALTKGLADAVQPLLALDSDPQAAAARAKLADTAIFYSISNCQDGLRGVSFGNFLIKQVVEVLKAELPNLIRFSTLSPVPGFRRWLEQRGPEEALLAPEQQAMLAKAWWENPDHVEKLRPALLRAAALYLTQPAQGGGIDPVGRFHLNNGARLERINWMGNSAPRGLRESFGIMVNYLYDLPTIEANHEAFVREGLVARSAGVEALKTLPGSDAKRRKIASLPLRKNGLA